MEILKDSLNLRMQKLLKLLKFHTNKNLRNKEKNTKSLGNCKTRKNRKNTIVDLEYFCYRSSTRKSILL